MDIIGNLGNLKQSKVVLLNRTNNTKPVGQSEESELHIATNYKHSSTSKRKHR